MREKPLHIDCEAYQFPDDTNTKARIKVLKRTLRQLKRQDVVDMYRIERYQKMIDELEDA